MKKCYKLYAILVKDIGKKVRIFTVKESELRIRKVSEKKILKMPLRMIVLPFLLILVIVGKLSLRYFRIFPFGVPSYSN